MDIEQFRKAGYAAIDAICDYYANLDNVPVKAPVEPGFLINALPTSAPEKGEDFTDVAADFQKLILPGITHWQHGSFFAYFPAMTTFESILGELLSASVSNPGFNWQCSPACTELEQVVLDWMVGLLGLHDDFLSRSKRGGGIILGSASESTLTAAVAARERALARTAAAEDASLASALAVDIPQAVRDRCTPKLVMYGSTQTHSVGLKASIILGLQFRALPVSSEDEYALRGATLQKAIEEDVAKGLIPFMVVATVGSTSSGAVDRIDEIGAVVRAHPTIFMHVDAAWAGVAYALPAYRDELAWADVNQYADSFCTNAHKWGLTGFDCSLFFVRNSRDLSNALDVTPAFLRTKEGDSGAVVDYRNWQIALGRRFRSLKLWFVLRGHGAEGFRRHLEQGIDHCAQLADIVRAAPDFELVARPRLALLDFRLAPAGTSEPRALDALNQALYRRLEARHDVILTQTKLSSVEGDVYCIRFAMGGLNTTMGHVRQTWEVVEREGAAVLAEWRRDDATA